MGGVKNYLVGGGGQKNFRATKSFLGVLNEEKKRVCAKKGRQKFWGMRQKNSRVAANLRSAPGGRHPSYATAQRCKRIRIITNYNKSSVIIDSNSDFLRGF